MISVGMLLLAWILSGREWRCTAIGFALPENCMILGLLLGVIALSLWMRIVLSCGQEPCQDTFAHVADTSLDASLTALEIGRIPQSCSPTQDVTARRHSFGSVLSIFQNMLKLKRYTLLATGVILFIVSSLFSLRTGSYDAFVRELDSRFGFMVKSTGSDATDTSRSAPVWLGEFGSRTDKMQESKSWIKAVLISWGLPASSDQLWWDYERRYLGDRAIHWAYWCLNGEQENGIDEDMGLLMPDMVTVRYHYIVDQLRQLVVSKNTSRSLVGEVFQS